MQVSMDKLNAIPVCRRDDLADAIINAVWDQIKEKEDDERPS